MNEAKMAALLAGLCVAGLAAFWLMPGGVLALRRRAGGALQVDVRFSYTVDTLYRLLQAYGPQGRREFRRLLWADMAFPALYAVTFYVIADVLGSASMNSQAVASAARCSAIMAAGFDYAENVFLLRTLRDWPGTTGRSARLASLGTTLKMMALAVTAASLAAAWAMR